MGNLEDAALYGFVGAMVVLASLSNYWKYKGILQDFKDLRIPVRLVYRQNIFKITY